MAAKYSGTFVSKTEIDKKKEHKRAHLEAELEEARSKFEARKRSKELREQRGETTWMLPSLSRRIKDEEKKDKSSEYKPKKKKKHEKKAKKYKKEKKHKKHKTKEKDRRKNEHSSESSESASDDDWVEKEDDSKVVDHKAEERKVKEDAEHPPIENPNDGCPSSAGISTSPNKREDWMLSTSLLDYVANSSESHSASKAKKAEEKREKEKMSILQPGQHPRELNPHWKDGGTGLPDQDYGKETESKPVVGDAGKRWIQKAFQRAKEQAEDQGRSLEDVVAERWGSMEKLNVLLKASEKKDRPNDDRHRSSGWRKDDRKPSWRKGTTSDGDKSVEYAKRVVATHLEQRKQESTVKDAEVGERDPLPSHRQHQASSVEILKSREYDASSESSDHDSDSEEECEKQLEVQPLTENEINAISAKILRAELLGNQELVDQLKMKLKSRKSAVTKVRENISKKRSQQQGEEEEVVLTRTNKHGNVYPLKISEEDPEPKRKRKKLKRIETHDAKGNRLRYHQMDDTTDLKSMIEEERLTTSEDHQQQVLSRLSGKLGAAMGDYYTLDDMFETSSANKESRGLKDEKAKKRAIAEHHKSVAVQSKCRFCFDSPEISKHLIVSMASHTYMALPITESLTDGHCLIIPMQHILAATYLDEDVMQEVMMFKKTLVEMFKKQDEDVIFLETFKSLKRQHHMFIDCIPVPKEVGDMAPIYFKKAIQESETEWAQNKKVVEIEKSKGIKKAIPKGLPYFSVEFGMDGGFAHVIEDEESFQLYFGKEIIGGILDLEPKKWRNPHKETFQKQKRKVLRFSDNWQEHDWTRDL